MAKRKISAKDLVADVKAGLDDSGLMEKYELTAQGLLQALTKLMVEGFMVPSELARRKALMKTVLAKRQRKVITEQVLGDVRAGMGDDEVMKKYGLSRKALQRVFERLVDSNLISHSELYELSPSYRDKMGRIEGRHHHRAHLTVPVPIYETGSSAVGLLRDISLKGFRVAGIESRIGDVKSFRIPVNLFMQADPLEIVGECRWVENRGGDKKYEVAGYRLVNFPDDVANTVRKFIGCLLFTESGEWKIPR